MRIIHEGRRLGRMMIQWAVALIAVGCWILSIGHVDRAAGQKPEVYSGLKISLLADVSHTGAAKALAKWFHDDTGAVVEVTTIHYSKILETIYQDNTSPAPKVDVYMPWYVTLGKLVELGALTDLTDFIESNHDILQPEDFIPTVYNTYTRYAGRRWGVPFDGDAHVLFYRKSLFRKYHLEPPETWDTDVHVKQR